MATMTEMPRRPHQQFTLRLPPELHARRAKTHEDKWQPSPTLVFAREKVPAVFCNRCDAERPAPDWRALTEEAQQSRCVNVSA